MVIAPLKATGGSPGRNTNKGSKSPVRIPQIITTSKVMPPPLHRKELDNKIEQLLLSNFGKDFYSHAEHY